MHHAAGRMENIQQPQNTYKDAGLYSGIVGALAFVVFILIFREDWTDRYRYLSYLLPLPVISLLLARKHSVIGGILLIALGIGAGIFDVYFSPAHPGQIAGRGLGYTWVFVTLPLVVSGGFFLALGWKFRK